MTALIAALLADADGWDGHMGWGGSWWMLIFGTLMMSGFAFLVVWLVRTTPGAGQSRAEDPMASAQRILAERYARGELSSDEYSERVEQLQ